MDKKQILKELNDELSTVKKEPLVMDGIMANIKHLIVDMINENIIIKSISLTIPDGYFLRVFGILKDYQNLLIYSNISREIKREKDNHEFDLVIMRECSDK